MTSDIQDLAMGLSYVFIDCDCYLSNNYKSTNQQINKSTNQQINTGRIHSLSLFRNMLEIFVLL